MFYNEELNASFLHIPKCGGVYVKNNLMKYYNFNDICRYINVHKDHYDFVEDEYHYNCDKDKYFHSIRTKGKYRYYLTHQDIDDYKIKNSQKFTFVRNPYEKILSAYMYVLAKLNENILNTNICKIHNTLENIDYFTDFNIFVKNYKNVNNISYSHAFITQYDQLCDFSGNINFNYIGKTETLDNDFMNILILLGIKHHKHIHCNLKHQNTSTYIKPIYDYYDEASFKFVNEWFKTDFEIFNYTKFNTFNDFKQYYFLKQCEPYKILDTNINQKYKELPLEILPRIQVTDKVTEQNIQLIPKRIMQTFSTNMVDIQIYNNIMRFLDKNKDYSYYFVTDEIGRKLIEHNFDKKTLYAFDKIKLGSAKGDFIRYIYLYLYGGIYLDIDADIKDDLNEFIDNKDENIFIINTTNNNLQPLYITQWFIAIIPKHPFMKKIIEEMVNRILQDEQDIHTSTGPLFFTCILYNYFNDKNIYNINFKNNENIIIINEIINKNTFGKIYSKKVYNKFISFHFPEYYSNMLYTNNAKYGEDYNNFNIFTSHKPLNLSENNKLYYNLNKLFHICIQNKNIYEKNKNIICNDLKDQKKINDNYDYQFYDIIHDSINILYNNIKTKEQIYNCFKCDIYFNNEISYNSHIHICNKYKEM